ncbi:MAG TPA: T9SS type A sorting domain-containing protein [Sphingobacteriaceae bacterium]
MKMRLLKSTVWGLPLMVLVTVTAGRRSMAQDQKELIRTVTITNGDTVINGKQLSKYDKKEREKFRKELREMEDSVVISGTPDRQEVRVFKRRDGKGKLYAPEAGVRKRIFREAVPGNRHVFRFEDGEGVVELRGDSVRTFRIDSLNRFHGRVMVPRDFSVAIPNAVPRVFARPGRPMGIFSEKNSQTFYFNDTDKEGISTGVSLEVSDAEAAKVKEFSGKEKADLEVQDLSFAPRFSSGEMMILFTLPKGSADVKLFDSNKKVIFSEKTAGDFARKVSMPKNGIYYLVIDQNGRVAVKRIVKQ